MLVFLSVVGVALPSTGGQGLHGGDVATGLALQLGDDLLLGSHPVPEVIDHGLSLVEPGTEGDGLVLVGGEVLVLPGQALDLILEVHHLGGPVGEVLVSLDDVIR